MDKSQTAPRRLLQSRRFWSSMISAVASARRIVDLCQLRGSRRSRKYFAARQSSAKAAERMTSTISMMALGAAASIFLWSLA